jgi:hypothetical protein
MTPLTPRFCGSAAALLLVSLSPAAAPAQSREVPLTPEAWVASDSLRVETFLGRTALYIDRGVALVRGVSMENGTLEMDVAASNRTSFLGAAFRAVSPMFTNDIFLRPGSSGLVDAVQYGPAFTSLGVAWQVYHGEGANAAVAIQRNRWIHLRIELDGLQARFYYDTAATPTLVVPHVVTSGGTGLGVWAGAFGRGAWYSNVRYTPAASPSEAGAGPVAPPGTLTGWELSNAVEAGDFTPSVLPDGSRLTWQRVETEPEGWVLVNRYREAPVGGIPVDSTGRPLVDSVMTGRMAGERVVYARTTITASRDEVRRLQYAYCNGVVVYLNGRPLAFNMNPGGLRSGLAAMARVGDAVYLPLKRGRNELVFAVVDLTGGWAFSARLDPR